MGEALMFDTQAAKARCEAATPGEAQVTRLVSGSFVVRFSLNPVAYFDTEGDAEFFAHAREDLPAALEALEAIGILADDWTLGSDDQMACAVEIKAVLRGESG